MEKIMDGNGFPIVIQLQKELLKEFIEIEGLPKYPLDINLRASQRLLKDFAYRFLEELSEAYEQLEIALNEVSTNHRDSAMEHIVNYNIEIADALHFFLEILIFSGLENEICSFIIEKDLKEKGMEGLIIHNDKLQIDLWSTLFNIGTFLNVTDGNIIPSNREFIIFSKLELGLNSYGGSKISPKSLSHHSLFLWAITNNLLKTMNHLKNRDWVQTEKKVNEVKYWDLLTGTLLVLFQYLQFSGFTSLSLFDSYQYKNEINKERIKTKY